MIIDLPDTTTGAIARHLVDLRESGGAVALGRVLTLILVTEDARAEPAIRAANDASREHPCRVIAVVRGERRGSNRLDAQIRVGGDAGASEVIVLRLYGPLTDHGDSVIIPFLLPDAPIVCWWPGTAPDVPAEDPIGRMAQRRVTDASISKNPAKALLQRASRHAPGDTDLAWTRTTLWRALLAAALDQPPYEPVTGAVVTGASDSPSTDLLAAWLSLSLDCPVRRVKGPVGSGLTSVVLKRPSGPVDLVRADRRIATLTQPGQPPRHLALPPRQDAECLAEELRRLDPDDVFAEVVTQGLPQLGRRSRGTAVPLSPDADGPDGDDGDGDEPGGPPPAADSHDQPAESSPEPVR
ncbi:MAG TPA: glucose-6-phosphate dehydrogenase assembly protein OpcA [Kineosporiaceae bacterium]|nr:glucose-6-phosphate dehydrogenase assembly protein OpcA [Kineosporiaceae bacterium]